MMIEPSNDLIILLNEIKFDSTSKIIKVYYVNSACSCFVKLSIKVWCKDSQKPCYLVQYEILYWAECNIRYIALCFPLICLHKVLHTNTHTHCCVCDCYILANVPALSCRKVISSLVPSSSLESTQGSLYYSSFIPTRA